jgi:hypothetical protein
MGCPPRLQGRIGAAHGSALTVKTQSSTVAKFFRCAILAINSQENAVDA